MVFSVCAVKYLNYNSKNQSKTEHNDQLMKQIHVTNECFHHSKSIVAKRFSMWRKWSGKTWRGFRCRVRCDVFALHVKAMAAWPDRAVYHTVLWWWILDWITWLVLASRRLKGLYYTHIHNCGRIWTGTLAKSNIRLEKPRIT